MARIELDGGKYTVINDNGLLSFERHRAPWPAADAAYAYSGVVLAMAHEIEQLRARLDEVHSWILSPASPDDLMQNALRIEQVTDIAQPFQPKD